MKKITQPIDLHPNADTARLAKTQPKDGIVILVGEWTAKRASGSCRVKIYDRGKCATMSAFLGGKRVMDVVLKHTKEELRQTFVGEHDCEIPDKTSKVGLNVIITGFDKQGVRHEISLQLTSAIIQRTSEILS